MRSKETIKMAMNIIEQAFKLGLAIQEANVILMVVNIISLSVSIYFLVDTILDEREISKLKESIAFSEYFKVELLAQMQRHHMVI